MPFSVIFSLDPCDSHHVHLSASPSIRSRASSTPTRRSTSLRLLRSARSSVSRTIISSLPMSCVDPLALYQLCFFVMREDRDPQEGGGLSSCLSLPGITSAHPLSPISCLTLPALTPSRVSRFEGLPSEPALTTLDIEPQQSHHVYPAIGFWVSRACARLSACRTELPSELFHLVWTAMDGPVSREEAERDRRRLMLERGRNILKGVEGEDRWESRFK